MRSSLSWPAKPVTISPERPRFASRLNPGPATNVAPLAPPLVRPRETVGARPRDTKRAATERKHETEPCRGPPRRLHPSTTTPRRPSSLASGPLALPAEASKRAATEAKEETKKEARDAKMPAREPIRMRRAKTWDVEVENAYRFQCAGWRSAEEYAQGEYGDEISWFSDSGLVEKVQNRQGLFMYFKRSLSVSATLPRWRRAARSPRRRGAGVAVAAAPRRQPSRRLFVAIERENHGACREKHLQ